MKISEAGKMEPWATGVRSPAGLGMIDGDLFYSDNQGDWMGSGAVWHLKKGAFIGHPAGLRWTGLPNSPVKLTEAQFFAKVDNRQTKNAQGNYIKPENRVDEKFITVIDMKKNFPEFQSPAVWLPHGILGISNSEILKIPENAFGPFGGQILVGDQGQSKIMRVFMEKINGEYQGAAFDFRSGFQSGVLRMAFAKDGSLFVGETNRGWGSAGEANAGLQRLVYNNKIPFEMRAVRAMPDGFEIEFTKPVDKQSAENLASYSVESFIYKYHAVYGSPTVNNEKCVVKGVKVSEDGMKARIVVNNLRSLYIHHINLDGVRASKGSYSLVHPSAYYTLNSIPTGSKLPLSETSTRNSINTAKKPASTAGKKASTIKTAPKLDPNAGLVSPDGPGGSTVKATSPTYDQVKGLLSKHTCLACHNTAKRQVGPAFVDVAKRNYSNDRIVKLIHNPEPQNWPDYATEMPPMPQVPRADALKIAAWINSLK
jgi:cytochrome c551/c552